MTTEEEVEILEKWNQMDNKEHWDFLIENQHLDVVVGLDYEYTWVDFFGKYNCSFMTGNGTGFVYLLDRLNIKYNLEVELYRNKKETE